MNEKLNVCLINDSFPPEIDGVANAVTNYARYINAEHGTATVVTPSNPQADDSAFPFPVLRYPSVDMTKYVGYRAGIPFSPEVLGKIEKSGFDIIHTHCPITSTMLARVVREQADLPIVFTYHTKFDIDIANALRSKLLQEEAAKILVENISACDEVWTVSRGAGENLRSLGYEGNYIVMPNGVDFPKGRVDDALIAEVTEGVDLPDGVPVFLFVGRMMWYKGIKIILDALKMLSDEGQDFRMVFVGGGNDRDEIVDYAASLELGGKLHFCPPIHDRERIRAWYCRADLFLFPSTFDTNGLVVREAAACALGSVLIKGSCAAEDVEDGVSGFLIDENAESMAAKLSALCKKPELMAAVGDGAQKYLYMSWETSVSTAYERYFAVIDNYRRGLCPKHEKLTDDMFRTMSKYLDSANRSREAQRQRIDELRTNLDEIRSGITEERERYLYELRMNRQLMKDDFDDTRARLREKLEDLTERIDRFL